MVTHRSRYCRDCSEASGCISLSITKQSRL
uniref:Uncharacterized protein n=1 Tax=Anguilla anguilla TaxID=7936 RepID=A0A0E9SZX6_ANGAN